MRQPPGRTERRPYPPPSPGAAVSATGWRIVEVRELTYYYLAHTRPSSPS